MVRGRTIGTVAGGFIILKAKVGQAWCNAAIIMQGSNSYAYLLNTHELLSMTHLPVAFGCVFSIMGGMNAEECGLSACGF